LVGTHDVPATQLTQLPAMHTRLVPHVVPFGRLPVSAHTDAPVAHDVAPVLHGLPGWQLAPAAHDTQLPALQTRSVPQVVPLARLPPTSEHEIAGEHTVIPVWQGFDGVHDSPAVHDTHEPPLQT
jgi:hypothetical protein